MDYRNDLMNDKKDPPKKSTEGNALLVFTAGAVCGAVLSFVASNVVMKFHKSGVDDIGVALLVLTAGAFSYSSYELFKQYKDLEMPVLGGAALAIGVVGGVTFAFNDFSNRQVVSPDSISQTIDIQGDCAAAQITQKKIMLPKGCEIKGYQPF